MPVAFIGFVSVPALSPTVIVLVYADISVAPFTYKPIIPLPLVPPPFLKLNSGALAGKTALSVVALIPVKYTPIPCPETFPKSALVPKDVSLFFT